MADDAVRYSLDSLVINDMTGLRHLYYQRTFIRIAEELGLEQPPSGRTLSGDELEELRIRIVARLAESPQPSLFFNSTLWGWNYGFDLAPSC